MNWSFGKAGGFAVGYQLQSCADSELRDLLPADHGYRISRKRLAFGSIVLRWSKELRPEDSPQGGPYVRSFWTQKIGVPHAEADNHA